MKNILHWCLFVLRIIIYLLLLPFFALWVLFKYVIFKFTLIRNLQKFGMPFNEAAILSKEINPRKILK
ncbi:MAG: hypothetical protein A2Y17_06400 [Clostridiales bacterium GWF2_38_85]|nr:MAG: hypothetical protein A2Y17_06400 [Clostridiales bacterium GWF2_38_85]HBL85524.1 hypothetical protein [Clostridiales bacterium]